MKSIWLICSIGFCISILFIENSNSQDVLRTNYPYSGVPDSSRYRTGMINIPLNFDSSINFTGDTFDSRAYFEEARFAEKAGFREVTFKGNADFRGTKFADEVDFRAAKFDKHAYFSRDNIFYNTAYFSDATFAGEAHFRRVKFAGRADFHGARFNNNADFRDGVIFDSLANFRHAKFASTVQFPNAEFNGTADFSKVTFDGKAIFQHVKFKSKAYFVEAIFAAGGDFGGATFNDVNFSRADLSNVILSNVNMKGANLSKSNLTGVDLNGAIADFANFTSCIFEPQSTHNLRVIGAKGLSTIQFTNPKPVVDLREALKKGGFRNEAKALTAAIRKYELRAASPQVRFIEKYLLGGVLTDYGANPWRSLKALCLLIIPFTILYTLFLQKEKADNRIWVKWEKGQFIKKRMTQKERVFQLKSRPSTRFYYIRLAIYFSLLSTFHIGWREFNIGSWITRMQKRDYKLQATGWVRTLSGIQSLVSVYLFVLWILTYFGSPFG